MIFLLGGTSDGVKIASDLTLAGYKVIYSSATNYGSPAIPGIKGLTGRLNLEQMKNLFLELAPECIVDATHPYAGEVTRNAFKAAESMNIPYLRYDRPSELKDISGNYLKARDISQAVQILKQSTGNILLTTGINDLDAFKSIPVERLFARVLPTVESIKKCRTFGLGLGQIIAAKGPFTFDENAALIRAKKIKYLVTKDSGKAGGFLEKIRSAQDNDATALVILRPKPPKTSVYTDIYELIKQVKIIGESSECSTK